MSGAVRHREKSRSVVAPAASPETDDLRPSITFVSDDPTESRGAGPRSHLSPSIRAGVALAFFLIYGVVFSWPLWPERATHIVGNPGDPILNTSVLWWSATSVPLTEQWWNPPYFYPTRGVTTFTENLLGISPLATPIYWVTGNPLTAYNLSAWLAWSLSGFALYLLVRHLTGRNDAAIIAGLAFGFSPYRTHEMGHLQMLSSYWIPFVLLGLHGYASERRARWLALFAAAWILQSLANMYMLLYLGVLICLWLVYFCSTRQTWRPGVTIMGAWAAAMVPLVPILLRYHQVHEYYGLARTLDDLPSISLPPDGFLQAASTISLWGRLLPDNENLFPGAVSLLLVSSAALTRWLHARSSWPWWKWLLAVVLLGSVAAAGVSFALGPWEQAIGGFRVHAHDADRALFVAVTCGVLLVATSRRLRGILRRRDAWVFYTLAVPVLGLCAYGPVVRVGQLTVFEHGPYWWLMKLPGFMELRVPFRIWLLGVLCLSVSAGYAFASFRLRSTVARTAFFVTVVAALSVDVWARITMAPAPVPWPDVEPSSRTEPIIEIPLGPPYDAAATYRPIAHRRPVVNGVSGYDPPHYGLLQDGLNAHEPSTLLALASFGAIDIVVNRRDDPHGEWERYVSSVPGIARAVRTPDRVLYRLPATRTFNAPIGRRLNILATETATGDPSAAIDGRLDTFWHISSEVPWIVADLGFVQPVGGVVYELGANRHGFPRRLAIDVSSDGRQWDQVFEDAMTGWVMRATIVNPKQTTIPIGFEPREARFVRLRSPVPLDAEWVIADVAVYARP
jgi:hypothetical protein